MKVNMIAWILVISGIVGFVGFWAFTLELLQGRVHRYSTWSELNNYQSEIVVMTISGGVVFLGTLMVAAISKALQ